MKIYIAKMNANTVQTIKGTLGEYSIIYNRTDKGWSCTYTGDHAWSPLTGKGIKSFFSFCKKKDVIKGCKERLEDFTNI